MNDEDQQALAETEARRVWLYAPNLIGYARVISALAAFYWHAVGDAWLFFIWYGFSYGLDAVDGLAARALNQASQFGAVLDMVTDRVCTNVLLFALASTYQSYLGQNSPLTGVIRPDAGTWSFLAFTMLAVLDLSSHWVRMFASLRGGSDSHKHLGQNRPALLRLYYGSRFVLFFLCAGNELCLALLYLAPRWAGPIVTVPSSIAAPFLLSTPPAEGVPIGAVWLAALATTPILVLKQWISVVQLFDSFGEIASMDGIDRVRRTQ